MGWVRVPNDKTHFNTAPFHAHGEFSNEGDRCSAFRDQRGQRQSKANLVRSELQTLNESLNQCRALNLRRG
jgi:hypothetical protein